MFQFVIRNSSFVILLLALIACGCQKKSEVVAPPPQVTPAPQPKSVPSPPAPKVQTPPNRVPPEVVSPPKTKTGTGKLDVGERYFKAGNYRQAILSLESFIRNNPKSSRIDQALFYLGLSRALANDSSRDLTKAESAFKRLITEFPKSPYRSQAEFILGLQAQIERLRSDVKERDERIKQLSDELQRLKEIDLQRRPSRPPD